MVEDEPGGAVDEADVCTSGPVVMAAARDEAVTSSGSGNPSS